MKTHQMTGTKEYFSWQNMKKRCTDPSNSRYHRYGGRGISICDRWMSFENFYADMGASNGMSLDRIDNDGNYEPGNCQWIPFPEQGKKTSRIRTLTFRGEALSIADWARRIGVRPQTISMRLNSYGWSVERALTKGGVL